jgi:hypothetical protein
MDAGEIGEIIERRLRIAFERFANFDDALARDAHGQLAEKLRRFQDRAFEFFVEAFDERVLRRVRRLRPFLFLLDGSFRRTR